MRALGRLAFAVAGLLVVIALVASVTVTTATAVVPARGGTYSEALIGSPGSLNPLIAPANACDNDVAALVFGGLTRRDKDGHISPDLAENWDVSADGRVFTFYLARSARWHDGAPVTADDVVYTVKMLQGDDFPIALGLKSFWKNVTAEKITDLSVKMTLAAPYAPFLQYTTVGLLPAHILAGRGDDGKDNYINHPLGTGPYRVQERTRKRTVLTAFADYAGPAPMIPRLEFGYHSDQNQAVAALKTGEVLAVADLAADQASALTGQPGIAVYWAPRASQTVVLFNLSLPFFDDANVRRALLSAIDRQTIVKTILNGKATVSDGPFLSTSWATSPQTPVPYDPNTARAMLDKARWSDSDKDGVRERNGVKLEFGLLTNDDPARVRVAQAVAEAWTQAGAAVEVQVVSSYNLLQDYLQPRRFEAVLFGWTDIADDPDPYEMWHSSQTSASGLNFTGFSSQKADEMLEEARRTSDLARRKLLYSQFQASFMEQAPALVLHEPMFSMAVSSKVQSVRLSFIGEPADRFRYLGEWYTATRTVVVTAKQRVR